MWSMYPSSNALFNTNYSNYLSKPRGNNTTYLSFLLCLHLIKFL